MPAAASLIIFYASLGVFMVEINHQAHHTIRRITPSDISHCQAQPLALLPLLLLPLLPQMPKGQSVLHVRWIA